MTLCAKGNGTALEWALYVFIVNYRAIIEFHSGYLIHAVRFWSVVDRSYISDNLFLSERARSRVAQIVPIQTKG